MNYFFSHLQSQHPLHFSDTHQDPYKKFQNETLQFRKRNTQDSFLVLATQNQERCPGVPHSV